MIRPNPSTVDILMLGSGWTSTFLNPLLDHHSLTHAATSTSGRDNTLPFTFSPTCPDTKPYRHLPSARTVVIIFPLKGPNQSRHLTSLYRAVHGDSNRFVQLGSTGIFTAPHWNDHTSPYNHTSERAVAEDELMHCAGGAVLNLAGLYGGARDPSNWVSRVVKSKEDVKGRKALHLVHGSDVARAVLALHNNFTPGKRWLITDTRVYDWWDLLASWGADAEEGRVRGGKTVEELEEGDKLKLRLGRWVLELMEEEGVRALPRGPETLGRVCDSRAFWAEMGVAPGRGRVR